MLELAIKHKEPLEQIVMETLLDDKYTYFYNYSYREPFKAATDTWSRHEFVSTHKGQILGFMAYEVDRQVLAASGLRVMNFGDPNAIFARDLAKMLQDIFEKYNFNKLNWSVAVGNPIEKSYDKMCRKYGGRIVGVFKNDVRLLNGQFADMKHYELSRDDYMLVKAGEKYP